MSTNLQNKSRTNPSAHVAIDIGAEFRRLRALRGLTAEQMASELEISRGYLSEIENGKSAPSEKILKAMGRIFDVNFLTSRGKQVAKTATPTDLLAHLRYPPIQPAEPLEAREKPSVYGMQAIPIYKIAASAGNGNGSPDHPSPESLIHFAPSYMRRHFGRVGDGFAMLYVKGDSMQPTLWDGDEIVIDTRERRVDRDGIYVVTVRSDLKVKRIQVRMDGSLVIKSDNAAYEPELIGAKQADEFQVEGRLVWPRLR